MNSNFEKFYNSSELNRFSLPSTIYWGNDLLGSLQNFLDLGKTEFFIDSNLKALCHSIFEEFPDSKVHLLKGVLWFEDIQEYYENSKESPLPQNMVAIGGGSVIDFAKGVLAFRLFGKASNLGIGSESGLQVPIITKPNFISMPSTTGSGAETSRYYVAYSRSNSKKKVHGKSWRLVSDKVLIDTVLLKNLPDEVLISSSFDAFIHFWESAISNEESNFITKQLAFSGIANILENIKILNTLGRSSLNLTELALSSTLAGVCISNSRTGNIHEAAGVLLENSNLNHGETLFVFMRTAYGQYKHERAAFFNQIAWFSGFNSFDEILDLWSKIFMDFGLTRRINLELSQIKDKANLIRMIKFKLQADDVWNSKESPVCLTSGSMEELANSVNLQF